MLPAFPSLVLSFGDSEVVSAPRVLPKSMQEVKLPINGCLVNKDLKLGGGQWAAGGSQAHRACGSHFYHRDWLGSSLWLVQESCSLARDREADVV